jgi:hypothetical protein
MDFKQNSQFDGLILSFISGPFVKCLLLDEGHERAILGSEVLVLDPQFLTLPPLAVKVRLRGWYSVLSLGYLLAKLC